MTRQIISLVTMVFCAKSGAAQAKRPAIGQPELIIQPGIVVTGFLNQPTALGSTPELLARFLTAIPIGIPRTTVVAIIQWTPIKDNGGRLGEGKANSLTLLYGVVVSLISGKFIGLDGDALFDYAPDPAGNSNYSHQFLLEGDLHLRIGKWMGWRYNWQNLDAYVDFAYQLTGRPTGEQNPAFHRAVLLTGLSLPIAPWH